MDENDFVKNQLLPREQATTILLETRATFDGKFCDLDTDELNMTVKIQINIISLL